MKPKGNGMPQDTDMSLLPHGALSYADAKGIIKTRYGNINANSPLDILCGVVTTRAINLIHNILGVYGKMTVKDFISLTDERFAKSKNCGARTLCEIKNIRRVVEDLISEGKQEAEASIKGSVAVTLNACATLCFKSERDADLFIGRLKANLAIDDKGAFTAHGVRYRMGIFKTPVGLS